MGKMAAAVVGKRRRGEEEEEELEEVEGEKERVRGGQQTGERAYVEEVGVQDGGVGDVVEGEDGMAGEDLEEGARVDAGVEDPVPGLLEE